MVALIKIAVQLLVDVLSFVILLFRTTHSIQPENLLLRRRLIETFRLAEMGDANICGCRDQLPTMKASMEASPACHGLVSSSGSILSSIRACAASASFSVDCTVALSRTSLTLEV
jgi:hypothetical protein